CVEEHWKSLKAILNETCSTVLGRKKRQDKEWLSTDTWKLIEERRMVKEKMIQCKDGQEKETMSSTYKALDKEVKKSARKDKRRFYDNLATEAEKAAGKRDLRTLYQITKSLSGKRPTQAKPIKDSQGNPITKEEKQIKQWADHFKGLLNRPSPATRPEIPTTARTQLQVDTNPPTRAEVLNAIKLLKAGKTAGPDGIPPEALKADPETTADMLTPLLQKVWKEGKVPTDWRKGYLVKLPKKGDLRLTLQELARNHAPIDAK
uniref:Reverse transcriptase domain-containing protein n=1 Tax=Trichobilharzia regenti TaxID=157069 RepID=A0AA85ILE8_TRIRE